MQSHCTFFIFVNFNYDFYGTVIDIQNRLKNFTNERCKCNSRITPTVIAANVQDDFIAVMRWLSGRPSVIAEERAQTEFAMLTLRF